MRQARVVSITAEQEYNRRESGWPENVVAPDVFAGKSVVTDLHRWNLIFVLVRVRNEKEDSWRVQLNLCGPILPAGGNCELCAEMPPEVFANDLDTVFDDLIGLGARSHDSAGKDRERPRTFTRLNVTKSERAAAGLIGGLDIEAVPLDNARKAPETERGR